MKRHPSTRRGFLKVSCLALGAAAGASTILSGAEPASTAANSRIGLALVGCGGQGRSDLNGILGAKINTNLVALCDVDPGMIEKARDGALRHGGEATKSAKACGDYRQLLTDPAVDAVIIGTPDHWHAPIAKAFIKAGKHVYCEKPLTRTIAEARELRELARGSKVVTQMGNQGGASVTFRRAMEVIQAGALGPIRDIYEWGIGVGANEGVPPGEDPIPQGLNWDFWIGPSPVRPYKKDIYHPFRWRSWYDFGNGGLADIGCHSMNLPLRALELGYPEKVVLNVADGKQLPDKAMIEFRFAARGELPPLTLHWQGGGKPPAAIIQPVVDIYKDKTPGGVMIVGEKGCIYTDHWNSNGLIRLAGESRMTGILNHPATKAIPQTLPRVRSHGQEWIHACRGEGKALSCFEIGGKLTEIVLTGVLAARIGKSLDWNGEKMEAANAPEAARVIRTEWRAKWLA